MDKQSHQQLAAQLRMPVGVDGIRTGEWMNRGNVHINLDTIEILNAIEGDNILEIGMGNGYFVKDVLQNVSHLQYTGVDFSAVMVEEAKKINTAWINKGQVKFILSNAAALPFADAAFNKIFSINTIYFWDDATAILAEIKRVLQPKGKLIVALRPKRLMKNYPFTQYGFTMFTREEMIQLLTTNGLTIAQAIEKQEPDFELNGEMVKIESLIIEASKK